MWLYTRGEGFFRPYMRAVGQPTCGDRIGFFVVQLVTPLSGDLIRRHQDEHIKFFSKKSNTKAYILCHL
jgi:hypothetical protein